MHVKARLMLVTPSLLLAACGVAPPIEIAYSTPAPAPADVRNSPAPPPTIAPTATLTPTLVPSSTPPVPRPEPTPDAITTAEATTMDEGTDAAAEMVAALNLRRIENNCGALAVDPRLQAAAEAHAADLAARNTIDHLGADGATLEQRLARVDYPFKQRSETVARSVDTAALAIVDLWLNEPADGPHRSTILNCLYQDVGVGSAQSSEGRTLWVVDFGQSR